MVQKFEGSKFDELTCTIQNFPLETLVMQGMQG